LFAISLGLAIAHAADNQTAHVLEPALAEILTNVHVPVLVPSRLPAAIAAGSIKLATGRVTDDGYFISLYFTEDGTASYAAGFGASMLRLSDLGNVRRVKLSGKRVGIFRAVSCGGSCAPANLWWEQNGVTYQIQISLAGRSVEMQMRTLVQTANSMVEARRN
jgi:hypothetical protein